MSALPWDEPSEYTEPDFLRSQPPVVPAAERERLFREQASSVKAGYTPNPYRDMPTHELLDEKEFAGWSLVDVQATLGDLLEADREPFAFTLWHARTRLDHIEKEIQRRRELLKSSGKRPDLRLNERQHIDFCKPSEKDRLDKRNGRIVVRCMLNGHQDDDTPSFTVYTDQGSFHCYGCGRGGDVVDLAKHWFSQENSSYAVNHLCMTMGIEVPRLPEYAPVPDHTPHVPDQNGNSVPINPALLRRRRTR
jgi:hypothetical protein